MELDELLARRLVRDQFPAWADLPVTPVEVGGWDNRTFRLGDELSVRLPSGEWYALQVAKEQRWLPVLAKGLPLPIPTPVALGRPALGYPYPWSVYRWLDGRSANTAPIVDHTRFATDLAGFLAALRRIDATGGLEPGKHNFFRGAPVEVYAEETLRAIDALGAEIPRDAVRAVWDDAVASRWTGAPVWFHGDVAVGNLLVRDGRLSAVIDFGTSGVGDPACDVVIAWTLLTGGSRDAFRRALDVDAATWARGRGWALWKALITLVEALERGEEGTLPRRDIRRVLADAAG
ncbi:aminoglycoside phosphotransferase family protein [Actinokineospora sp. UTMC 2448]|uniref:aminoglycoside phosphotransferase family protein n=1 Tax=Actinokineospora sp. UTMC 2448 TaxID=2268449 RepID=UPI0021649AAF|nr:aminoglycoside phosphotransferase family protein [Actinokineospora sp. UTMC 2448]UVS81341.1 Aminoglycoside phosphotransferase [Actinokineospora sp. UTMC 2448]